MFTEAAYRIHLQPATLEPFANLAYVHLNTDSFTEKGDAAALSAGSDNRDAVLSTLGVRALKTIAISDRQKIDLSGSLGWQHNLSNTDSEQHLAFASAGNSFNVQSVSMDRDAAVVGARASLRWARMHASTWTTTACSVRGIKPTAWACRWIGSSDGGCLRGAVAPQALGNTYRANAPRWHASRDALRHIQAITRMLDHS